MLLSHENDAAETSTSELRARLRGELAAIGFDVLVMAPPEGVDVRDAVETAARELSPSAVIGIREPSGAAAQAGLEVWISDRLSGRTFVERSTPSEPPSRQIGLLAVEVSESFKARLSALREEPGKPASAEPQNGRSVSNVAGLGENAEPGRPDARPSPSGSELLAGAGFGVIRQLNDGVDAWFPRLELGIRQANRGPIGVALRANLGLTPSANEFMLAGARARTTQVWALAQGILCIGVVSHLELVLSLGGGVYGVGVKGEAESPDTAHEERTWSPAATFGLGAWIETSDALILALEGQGLSTWSKTVVRIRGEDVASFGFPAGIFSASLIGRY